MDVDKVAPGLQGLVEGFLQTLRWDVQKLDDYTLRGHKRVGGNELQWMFHFEDDKSISQAGSPGSFASTLVRKAEACSFFDVIMPQTALEARRWKDYLSPEVERAFSGNPNRRFGSITEFFNRYAHDVAEAYKTKVEDLLRDHFVREPVKPSFKTGHDALKVCADWVAKRDSPRIMLVTGDAGSGKSVFSLSVMRELRKRFIQDPHRYPAPFLIRFIRGRNALISDVIELTVSDLGLELTGDSIRFLVEQGRLILVLDGFDEISMALAEEAQDNVEELSKNINRRTLGRLMLTARPSFVVQEDILGKLKSSCGEDSHVEYEIAPYTDEQMHQWVRQNPPEGALQPVERHWQRMEVAFRQEPEIKELCRTPIFLRMMSEVLVNRTSVDSLWDLMERFCETLWERERGKRQLLLSDMQYFYAYEAISAAIDSESRIEPREVRSGLELYLEEYSPELLAGLPNEARTLIENLSIGPLTYKNGVFTFIHEVLSAYFFARMLARSLQSGRQIEDLWNRSIGDAVWRFLPAAVKHVSAETLDRESILRRIISENPSGLVTWNVTRALEIHKNRFPKDLFAGKRMAGILFDQLDLSGISFDRTQCFDICFDRCILNRVSLRGATVHKMKIIGSGDGIVFDDSLCINDDSELMLVSEPGGSVELYVGQDVTTALRRIAGERREKMAVPRDLAERALIVILGSLYKTDMKRLDYPEWSKVESRMRGWIGGLDLPVDKQKNLARIFMDMALELRDNGWFQRNQNRTRTWMPSPDRQPLIMQLLRLGAVKRHSEELMAVTSKYQDQATKLFEDS